MFYDVLLKLTPPKWGATNKAFIMFYFNALSLSILLRNYRSNN